MPYMNCYKHDTNETSVVTQFKVLPLLIDKRKSQIFNACMRNKRSIKSTHFFRLKYEINISGTMHGFHLAQLAEASPMQI